jgi:anti-anti-sigma factor
MQEGSVNGVPRIALSGRLDADTAPGLRTVLLGHIKSRPARVLLDLAGLEFMGTSGLATLVDAQSSLRRQNGELVLVGLPPHIAEVLSVTRLKSMFTIAGTEQEAAGSAPGP